MWRTNASVVCDHASEKIGRDAAHKPRRRTQTRHPDSDVEARPADDRYGRVASVNGFDGQEINQGISATQQHGANFSSQWLRSMRYPASYRGFPGPAFASAREPAALSDGSPRFRASSIRLADRPPTSRSSPATMAREPGSANGDRLPRNSGRTWMSRANSAASPMLFERETMRRSRNSRISMPAACAAATASLYAG